MDYFQFRLMARVTKNIHIEVFMRHSFSLLWVMPPSRLAGLYSKCRVLSMKNDSLYTLRVA